MPGIESLGNLSLAFAQSVRSRGLTRQSARPHMLAHDVVLAWTVVLPPRSQLSHDFWVWQTLSWYSWSWRRIGHLSLCGNAGRREIVLEAFLLCSFAIEVAWCG